MAGGMVHARAVGIATGAYAAAGLSPLLRGQCTPVLSNSIITRPLTSAELDATGFRPTEVITDAQ
jgi:glycine/D-amino acid oxidase-like deaminating enzyme